MGTMEKMEQDENDTKHIKKTTIQLCDNLKMARKGDSTVEKR